MDIDRRRDAVFAAFRIVHDEPSEASITAACRRLIVKASSFDRIYPFSDSDIDAITCGVISYINEDYLTESQSQEIKLGEWRNAFGKSIEYHDFASKFSEEALVMAQSERFDCVTGQQLREYLQEFLVALLFRYKCCFIGDIGGFSLSVVLKYVNAVQRLNGNVAASDDNQARVLLVTIRALSSLEETFWEDPG